MNRLPFAQILCLVCFLPLLVWAEEIKINKALDCNLFELDNGQWIKLANVVSPSVFDSDSSLAALARIIKRFAEDNFIWETLVAEFPDSLDENCRCYPVHLFRKLDLSTTWYNKLYLENGYGKYVGGKDAKYRQEYEAAVQFAQKHETGIWNIVPDNPQSTRYSVNILAGAGDRPGFSNDYYREIHVSYEPIQYKRGIRIAFGLIQTDAAGDPEAPPDHPESNIETFYLPYLVPQYRVQGDNIGLNVGFFINLKVFTRENDPHPPPLFFSLGLKVGVLRACYLSVDVFNDFLFGPLAIGINFKTSNPYLHIWAGKVYFESGQNGFGFKLDALITKRYILRAQYTSDFDEQDKQYGFLVGLGYVLGKR